MGNPIEGARSALEGMKKQREELDTAISVMEKWIASQGGGGSIVAGSTGKIVEDEFFRMSTPEAVKKFLKIVGKPARAATDIVDGLKRGGLTGVNYTNVYTSLTRLQKKDEVVKVGDNWGLEEWYPPAPAREAKVANGKDNIEESEASLPEGENEPHGQQPEQK